MSFSLEIKWLGYETEKSPPSASGAKVKNGGVRTQPTTYLQSIKHSNSLAFTFMLPQY
jgi:hypothetical protein